MYLAVLGCAVALAGYAIAVSLPLLGDGVLFYLCMIFRTGFCDFDWARAFVAYISQWPLAASLGNGLADRSTAQILFSAGYIVPPIMGWLVALWLHRGTMLGWLGLALFCTTYLASSLFSVGEYNLTYALAALAASVILHPMRHRLAGAVVLAISAVVLIRSYESMALLGPALTFLIAVVLYRDHREQRTTPLQWGAAAIAVVSFCIAAAIAAGSIIDPRDPSNRGTAAQSLMIPLPQVATGFVLLALLVWCIRTKSVIRQRILVGMMSTIGATFLVLPVLWSRPMDQYYNRIIVGVTITAAIGIAVLAIWRYGMQVLAMRVQTWHVRAVLVIVATLMIPYAMQLHTVSAFFDAYHETLATRKGVIAMATTPMNAERFDRYRWRWNNPTMAFVLRTDTTQALVMNRPNKDWQPFDPQDSAQVAQRIRKLPVWYYRTGNDGH
jgi:hypothetical protein